MLPGGAALAANVDLGDAAGFGVLAGSAITNTGVTVINGDMGTFSGTPVTGAGTIMLSGIDHNNDALTQSAHGNLLSAFTAAAAQIPTLTYNPVKDLGGETLFAGVYNDPTSFGITGILTLDGLGDPNSIWVFQMGSTLTTAIGSSVLLINGASADNVFWQVGSSATLGATSNFAGTIMALTSITLNTGAVVDGRALAYNGAVTMIGNTVIVPVPEISSALLSTLGFAGLLRRRR